jgi:transcription antitermination protein NusB
MSRRKAREYALKAMYLIDASEADPDTALGQVIEMEESTSETDDFLNNLVRGTMEHMPTIDNIIRKYAIGWSLSRMAIIDRALLRIAIFEIFYVDDIPASVSINEAVELANKYSTHDSGKFINGILGKITRDNTAEEDSCQI